MMWIRGLLNWLVNFVLGLVTIGAILGFVTWMNLGAHWPWYVQLLVMACVLATIPFILLGPTLLLETFGVRKPKA